MPAAKGSTAAVLYGTQLKHTSDQGQYGGEVVQHIIGIRAIKVRRRYYTAHNSNMPAAKGSTAAIRRRRSTTHNRNHGGHAAKGSTAAKLYNTQ